MRLLLRGATVGCLAAAAMAVVLVLWPTQTKAQQATERSLRDSGVVVVTPGTSGGRPFEDVGGALRLAAVSLGVGVVAAVALTSTASRWGRPLVWGAAGLALSVLVLFVAGQLTWRQLAAQAAVWAAALVGCWWTARRGTTA